MNASRKGSSYENAYRRVLEARGYTVIRSTVSHGPWDLVALHGSPLSELLLIQAKNDGRGCASAQALAMKLREHPSVPSFARVLVVHPGRFLAEEERFCEH